MTENPRFTDARQYRALTVTFLVPVGVDAEPRDIAYDIATAYGMARNDDPELVYAALSEAEWA